MSSPNPLPRITLVTPSYNQGNFIQRTIASVVEQGYPNLEYIVIDGGSQDGTIEILQHYEAQLSSWVSEPDGGQGDALAKGFRQATGEILGWLNADDCLEPGSLAWIGQYFADYPQIDWMIANDIVEINGWSYPNIPQRKLNLQRLLAGQILFQDAIFFRRKLYESTEGINSKLWGAMDYDLWLQFLLGKGRYKLLPDRTLSRFVMHEGQKSSYKQRYREELAQIRSQRTQLRPNPVSWFQVMGEKILTKLTQDLYQKWIPGKVLFHLLQPNSWYFHTSDLPAFDRIIQGKTTVVCPLCSKIPNRLALSAYDNRFHQPGLYEIVWCSPCNLGMTRPQLSHEDLVDLYRKHYSQDGLEREEKITKLDSEYNHSWISSLKQKLKRFISSRPVLPSDWSGNLLDFGCNDGEQLEIYRQTNQFELYGLDINPSAVAIAQRKGFKVHCGDLKDAPWGDHFFDVIVLSQVIEHLPDPIEALIEIRQKLKPGGHLLLTCPNAASFWSRAFRLAWAHWHVPYHLYHHTPQSVRSLAEKAGFQVKTLQTKSPAYWLFLSLDLHRNYVRGNYLNLPVLPRPGLWDSVQSVLFQGVSWLVFDRLNQGDMITAILKPDD